MGIFSPDGATLLGGIGVNQISWRWNIGNIGYWVRQSCQRTGIAPRAVRAAAQFGFGYLKLTRLEISGIAITGAPLDFLVNQFFLKMFPDAKVDQPFDLRDNIDSIRLRPDGVRVTMKK